MWKEKVRGSLTVEAAIVVPLVLFVFVLAMQSGISMYTECRDTAAAIREEEELDIVKLFYRWREAGEFLGNEDGIY